MTRSAFFMLLCLTSAMVLGSLAVAANPGSETDQSIENVLAVQRAVLQARDYLVQSEPKRAVEVLEANLPRINGDRKYLALLRDAYRAHIKDLTSANQQALVELYQKRLKILEDHEASQQALAGMPYAGPATPPQVTTSSTIDPPRSAVLQPPVPKSEAPVKPAAEIAPAPLIARGKVDPFDPANETRTAPGGAQTLLMRADAEFGQKRYASAKQLYEQAFQTDSKLVGDIGGRWAYCQLQVVVEQINRYPEQPCDWVRLESEVKKAVTVAPHLAKTGDMILGEMNKRRVNAPADLAKAAVPAAAVKHLPRGKHGWLVAETSHFRVFHNQTPEFAEKVAQIAEATRVQMSRKWFGKDSDEWMPKCDIYLHATAADYSQQTSQNPSVPGHSRIELDSTSGRVVARQMHMRCDNPAMLEAILPHETTHVVLAGQFGNHHVPRWVDEGVAVLTEPVDKVQQHRKNLSKSLKNRELIPLRELMHLDKYPEPRQIGTFYAQSVALVDFLTKQKGSQVFTQFVRDSLRDGYEPALRKHYGLQNLGELQDRFTERVLAEMNANQPAYAER
jgi:hypothetical protein